MKMIREHNRLQRDATPLLPRDAHEGGGLRNCRRSPARTSTSERGGHVIPPLPSISPSGRFPRSHSGSHLVD